MFNGQKVKNTLHVMLKHVDVAFRTEGNVTKLLENLGAPVFELPLEVVGQSAEFRLRDVDLLAGVRMDIFSALNAQQLTTLLVDANDREARMQFALELNFFLRFLFCRTLACLVNFVFTFPHPQK